MSRVTDTLLTLATWTLLIAIVRKPLSYFHWATTAVVLASSYAAVAFYTLKEDLEEAQTGGAVVLPSAFTHDDGTAWIWFDYVKRTSLLVGWVSMGIVSYSNFIGKPRIGRVCTQWVVNVNVLEAAALAFQYLDVVLGVSLIVVGVLGVGVSLDDDGYVIVERERDDGLFGFRKLSYLPSARTYVRLYMITLGTWHATSLFFDDSTTFFTLTCLLPLLWMEALATRGAAPLVPHLTPPSSRATAYEARLVGKAMMLRVYALVWYTILDTLADKRSMEMSSNAVFDGPSPVITDHGARNALQLGVTLLLLAACVFNDWRIARCAPRSQRANSEAVVASPL